jgi:hypothetical protein
LVNFPVLGIVRYLSVGNSKLAESVLDLRAERVLSADELARPFAASWTWPSSWKWRASSWWAGRTSSVVGPWITPGSSVSALLATGRVSAVGSRYKALMPPRDSPYRGRWTVVRRQVLARDGRRCWICGGLGADSVDHLDPVATNGRAIPPLDRLAAAHGVQQQARARAGDRAGGEAPERIVAGDRRAGPQDLVGRDPSRRPGA